MYWIKRSIDFYINSSLHVAFAVLALLHLTAIEFELPTDWMLYGFVFFGTITAYNFVKYAPIAKLHHRSLTTSLKVIQFFSLGCFLALLYFAIALHFSGVLLVGFFGCLTLLYVLPFLPSGKSLRTVPGLKIFIIALCWSGVTVLLPIQNAFMAFGWDVGLVTTQRFLLVVVLILPFEIRDKIHDSIHLKTLPQSLGVQKTKVFGTLLLISFIILLALRDDLKRVTLLSDFFLVLITAFFLWCATEKQSRYFSSFWVESLPIFGLIFYVLLTELLH